MRIFSNKSTVTQKPKCKTNVVLAELQ